LSGAWNHWTISDFNATTGQLNPDAALEANPNGQWGGDGGDGQGNGYGGAIACLGGSSPIISDCNISNNIARGACGGAGGAGGNAVSSPANASPPNYNGGNESFGGDAGNSTGDGMGGGIYCENLSAPTIVNCTFSNNIATTGARAVGGVAGQGIAIPDTLGGPATDGADGLVFSMGGIAGGAAYYSHPSTANFINCMFTSNKAYEAYVFYDPSFAFILGEDISAYTVGGALYSDTSNVVTLNTCDFINNMGGAVYCASGCTVNINNSSNPNHKCLFTTNSVPNGSGGAVHIGPSGSATIQNCIFGGNSAGNDGGALKCESGIRLTSCSFGSNTAENGYGGAVDVYTPGAIVPLMIDANNCSFSRNQALFGGGFSSERFTGTFSNCYFIGNTAEESGGLDLVDGNVSVTGSIIKDNIATDGYGGGLNCRYTIAQIRDCTIVGNSAGGSYPTGGCGGAINFVGQVSVHQVFNCLITGNSVTVDGGAIYCSGATPQIQNCTFDDSFAGGFGGAIYSDWSSLPQITNCIFRNCNGHAIHEEDYGGNAIAKYCLFYNNPGKDYYESNPPIRPSYNFGSVADPNGNFNKEPLFVNGALGGYYLSQITAGQGSNSPAFDSGLGTAVSLGLNTYTTRTDNVGDAGQVDRGYHYRKSAEVGTFQLTVSVVGGRGGSVAPASGTYYAGTIVTLTATPNPGWVVKAWTGTDNDASTNLTNSVVMTGDRTVTVEFRVPRTLIVSVGSGEPGYYSDIQDAVFDANDGDTIVVYPGIYYSAYLDQAVVVDRSVLITSRNPDDPACVAATIIDGLLGTNPYTNVGVTFTSNTGAGTVLNGFTIRNCGGTPGNQPNGSRPQGHPNGYDGVSVEGPAIFIGPGGSATIKNCVLRDNWIRGGNGGNGVGASATQNAGRGGWSGWAHGGAVYCGPYSSATFLNCRIIDNQAIGGNGGNGGNDIDPGGEANYGGTWSRGASLGSPSYDIDPESLDIIPIITGNLWEIWQWDEAATYWSQYYGDATRTSYFGDYRWYSGYGGAAYCDVGSNVTFTDCDIIGNVAQGSMSGLGGLDAPSQRPMEPLVPYEIPSFGGGVYCAANATVTFTGCTITDNISSPPVLADVNNPTLGLRHRLDPYLGHGGGVCAEDTAKVLFNNCTFSENRASVGGGLNWANANLIISDCNFTSNSAYHGGGLFGEHGPATIIGCNVTNNEAVPDPNIGELISAGGGVHCWATDVNIISCNISSNRAEGSGGGVYFGGENAPSLFNCLIAGNFASRDGGGVSADWYANVNIANCTVVDNTTTVGGADTGFGGGLYCSYNSQVNIINSIIWGNFGTRGAQLALCTGFEYDPRPSTADVDYSVIGPPSSDVNVTIEPAEALTINVTNDANVLADTILGPGIELISRPRYIGANTAAGTFAGGLAAGIGIESGIILTSGDANLALPPNTSDGITGNNNLPGDPDLDALLQEERGAADVNTYDAAVLEFTFRTRGGNLFFKFVFASDEYNEFTNSQFNDVFGFFLDGTNIALIPGTKTPVAINNVNGGNPLGTNASNPRLFNNNDTSDGGPFFDIEYDGFTSVFTAQALNIGSGNHTIKLAIADTSDYVLDSAVFIQAGSFSDKPLYPDPIYVDKGCTLTGWDPNAPDPNDPWDPSTHNLRIDADPCFVAGYYLSQVAAGQLINSPAVNAGSTLASIIGLNTYTTRTDSGPDSGIVDMGYHYRFFTAPQYKLTINASGVNVIEPIVSPPDYSRFYNWYTTVHLTVGGYDPSNYQVQWTGTDDDSLTGPNNTVTMDGNKVVTARLVKSKYNLTIKVDGGNGRLFAEWVENGTPHTIEAPRTNYPIKFGTVVQLVAEPAEGYRVGRWSGSDNDTSRDPNNTVTINSDRTVTVEFEQPATINVPGDYSSIQQALDAAEEGDTILIAPGTYTTSTGYLIYNKAVTISSIAPDDPCVVAATVINMQIGTSGYINTSAFIIYNVGPETVLNGITIRGFVHQAYGGLPGDELGEDGYNGDHAYGGAIICYIASPTIKNCIIADCSVIGGNGGNGYNGSGNNPTDPNIRGTDGGWPGRAYGGGLACIGYSNPAVINCTFQNCSATGGNGGDGGNGSTAEEVIAYGGRGGGWYYGEDSRWFNVPWYGSSQGYARYGPVLNSFYDFYTEYTGRGGAVFVGEQCSPTFTHCTFTNNRTAGGTCGICGLDGFPPNHRVEPSIHWQIENFGGAVFCETNSSPTFADCNFTGNTADTSYPSNNDDPYVSYGGAVAWETGANATFEDCTFNNNLAAIGGAMYAEWAYSSIVDCDVAANTAFHGGGAYFIGGAAAVTRSYFSQNQALYDTSIVDPNNPDVIFGEGGAIYCFESDANIADCDVFNNDAAGSGGGIYIAGGGKPLVKNCLITSNFAGRDGGGVSAGWYSDVNVVNCTIADNMVTGGGFGSGYGGGLYCSYNSYVNIINSIIWGNLGGIGAQGSQLAVGTGFEYDPRPSTINVTYSDIQDATDPNAFGAKIEALDLVFCIDTTGSMFDDIAAVKAAANQITSAIASKIPDFRIAVVDYKDFNQANYGATTDYPYKTDLRFSTDTRDVVAAINSLSVSGGADTPEAVYTALMHCMNHSLLAQRLAGQLYGASAASLGPGTWRSGNVLRVIILMGDAPPHDPEPFTNYTLEDIIAAAGGAEPKQIMPLLIGGDPAAAGYFRGLANGTGGTVLEAAGAAEVVPALLNAIDLISLLPDPVFVSTNCTLNWNRNTFAWNAGSHNIDEDPLFVGGYYLSQVAAGQTVNSPAVNVGSALASVLGMDKYATRIDGVHDTGIVDMGYHYRWGIPRYQIRVIVAEDPTDPGIHGTVEPSSGWYYEGEIVTLRANADPGYYLKGWYDDSDRLLSIEKNFTITVDSNEVFSVRFKLPRNKKIEVSGGGDAIITAVSTAEDGDTLIVAAGTYDGDINLRGKSIKLVCTNPDDPNVVARTIIDPGGSGRGFIFSSGEDAGTVVDGFTIVNGSVTGENGGGIYVSSNSSPTIVNVVISNCAAVGGDGGGIFVDEGSGATFVGCTVTDCTADEGGGVFCGDNSAPIFDRCTFRNNSADVGGGMYCGVGCLPDVIECTFSGNAASEDGGGLFCDSGSAAAITDCNFAANSADRGAGVYCENRTATTITGGVFIGNTATADGGAAYWVDANMVIVDSNIASNSAIRGGGLWCETSGEAAIVGCTIGLNRAGPRIDEPNNPNDPNAQQMGQGGGLYCFGTPVVLRDCIINRNVANTSGGGVYLSGDSGSPQIANCLIINNSSGRDGGGVSVNWYAKPFISNCTFVANATTGYFGTPGNSGFGGGLYCSYHSNSVVIDSIFWNDFAVKGFEIAVGTGFEPDPRPATLTVSYSDVKNGWAGIQVDSGCTLNWPAAAGNINANPLFASGIFGSYYLSQTDVGDPAQTTNSPCVDAGSDYAGNVDMIRYTAPTGEIVGYTTRTDGELERGKVDMGYHYRTPASCRFCDLIQDQNSKGRIDLRDFAKFASRWLNSGCSDLNGWCAGSDFTYDRYVNAKDLVYFAQCWLVEDTEAPVPDPSEWEVEPYLTSPTSIKMIARTAFDAWGWNVQYFFDCVYGNCHDRSWQSDRTYEDTGLMTGAAYGYRVKARDEMGHETQLSVIRYAGVIDTTPPAPPPSWLVPPYRLPEPNGQSQIAMEATASFDESGVFYGFWNVTRDPAGNNIVWQSSRQFTDVNLVPATTYCYKVAARDGSVIQNATAWPVVPACATTLPPGDITKPTPNPAEWDSVLDANNYNGRPRKFYGGGGSLDYYATMRAAEATDASGVEYKFVDTFDGRFSSKNPEWRSDRTYTVVLGGSGTTSKWVVYVRDLSPNHNTTGPSEEVSAEIRPPP
jgi:hypothetical protein